MGGKLDTNFSKLSNSCPPLEENIDRCINEKSLVMRKLCFAYAKTKTQISFAVTAKLISAFVFASWKVQYLYFLNTKFQLWLYSPVCVRPGRKPRRPVFSQRGSNEKLQTFLIKQLKLSTIRPYFFYYLVYGFSFKILRLEEGKK